MTMAELATGGRERAGGGVTREEGETRMGEAAEWIREWEEKKGKEKKKKRKKRKNIEKDNLDILQHQSNR